MIRQRSFSADQGFTLIEVIIYVVITAMILTVAFQMVMTVFNINKQLRISHEAQQNVRLLDNLLINNAHNVVSITDVRPQSESVFFYTSPEQRFALRPNNGRIEYYEQTYNQSTGQWVYVGSGPTAVTTERAVISNWTMTPIEAPSSTALRGVIINFTLTLGDINGDIFSYNQASYQIVVSLRL